MDPTLSISQIIGLFVQATPYGTIVAFVLLLILDVLGPSKLRKAADDRADKAVAALAGLTAKVEQQANATLTLTREHEEERKEWQQEMAGLTRELATISGQLLRR